MHETEGTFAGIDVGTECVKAVVMNAQKEVLGRSVIPTRGYFQDCVQEALSAVCDDAQVNRADLAELCATGFGARGVVDATMTLGESTCHALGAYHHFPDAMTVVDVGGREPKVIPVDANGQRSETRSVRRCAVGIGTFLMFASRHLDVHPTRLEELAAAADKPAVIGSYCSVFASSEILDRLLEGATTEEVAAGCIRSVAERVFEIGGFDGPLVITGGVAEYFPGVLKALGEMTGLVPRVVPEPITTGALGAALHALSSVPAGQAQHGS